jgi:hypothetical protein
MSLDPTPALSRRDLLGSATVLPIGAANARHRGPISDPVSSPTSSGWQTW